MKVLSQGKCLKNFELKTKKKKLILKLFRFTKQSISASVRRTRLFYGGFLAQYTKVITSVGTLDPWRSAAPAQDVNNESPTIFLTNANHCNDFLIDINFPETEDTKKFFETLYSHVRKWLE